MWLASCNDRTSSISDPSELVTFHLPDISADPYLDAAMVEFEEFEQAALHGNLSAPLPEKDSFRAEAPTRVTEERVRETFQKLHGQTHDNFTISDQMMRRGDLTMQNIHCRAPYLETHVPQIH